MGTHNLSRVAAMHRLATPLLFVLCACDTDGRPPPTVLEAPSRQFVFEGVQIEERRAGRVLWSGTAKIADGDLSATDVIDVVLIYSPNADETRRFEVHAPRAHLAFDAGTATFEQVQIIDATGGTLDAGEAHYNEKTARIVASGPILFSARGLEAHASSGVVHLEDGTVEIEGPIVGRFNPRADANR